MGGGGLQNEGASEKGPETVSSVRGTFPQPLQPSLTGVETRSRCGPVPQHSNPLSPWQVLTAISGMGAIRRKREQVTPS